MLIKRERLQSLTTRYSLDPIVVMLDLIDTETAGKAEKQVGKWIFETETSEASGSWCKNINKSFESRKT
jgi:hypothetical protein